MFDTQMEPSIARDMIKGAADPLVSAFQLRYSQLLQLARTEGTTAEMLLQVRPRILHSMHMCCSCVGFCGVAAAYDSNILHVCDECCMLAPGKLQPMQVATYVCYQVAAVLELLLLPCGCTVRGTQRTSHCLPSRQPCADVMVAYLTYCSCSNLLATAHTLSAASSSADSGTAKRLKHH
jgi:hypothetical protein